MGFSFVSVIRPESGFRALVSQFIRAVYQVGFEARGRLVKPSITAPGYQAQGHPRPSSEFKFPYRPSAVVSMASMP